LRVFAEARIPVLAIDIPQPGAVFWSGQLPCGTDGGSSPGRYHPDHWNGEVDKGASRRAAAGGPVPQARMTGAVNAIREVITSLSDDCGASRLPWNEGG
jgi:ribose transport system substrate-binding protein